MRKNWLVSDMTKVFGYLHKLEWNNPYTNPPDGKRVLVEVYLPADQEGCRQTPKEIQDLWKAGSGYCHSICVITSLPKKLPRETLAKIRKQRLWRRVETKYPLFAQQMFEDDVKKNSAYYEGITDPGIEAERDMAEEMAREQWKRLGIEFVVQ